MKHEEAHSEFPEVQQETIDEKSAATRYLEQVSALENEDRMDELKDVVREKFEKYSVGTESFGEREVEALAVLEAHQGEAVDHSIRTYILIKDKMQHGLPETYAGQEKRFSDLIETSVISSKEFERAALLHDIGKILVPERILDDQTTYAEWQEKYDEWSVMVGDEAVEERVANIKEYNRSLYGKRFAERDLKPHEIVPVSEVLDANTQSSLVASGLNPDHTLKQIIDVHEKGSADILSLLGFKKEALIAGQHHHIRTDEDDTHAAEIMKIASEVEGLEYDDPHYRAYIHQLADLVHLADVTEALTSERVYKKEAMQSDVVAAILIDQSEEGEIGESDTYLWIKDEVENRGLCVKEALSEWCEKIRSFLANFETWLMSDEDTEDEPIQHAA